MTKLNYGPIKSCLGSLDFSLRGFLKDVYLLYAKQHWNNEDSDYMSDTGCLVKFGQNYTTTGALAILWNEQENLKMFGTCFVFLSSIKPELYIF
jgi:hypothetical protein